jgi:hypothetical protein
MFVFLFCMFSFLFCVVCVFVLFCVLFPVVYIVVSFLRVYKFTDDCHRVETQLQLINTTSYKKYGILVPQIRYLLSFTFLEYRPRFIGEIPAVLSAQIKRYKHDLFTATKMAHDT